MSDLVGNPEDRVTRVVAQINFYSSDGLNPQVILYYWSFRGDTSVVVLIVLCFGVDFLCCLSLMYVFIF